jgi:hypothetical protein
LASIASSLVIERPVVEDELVHAGSDGNILLRYINRWSHHADLLSAAVQQFIANPFRNPLKHDDPHGFSQLLIVASKTSKVTAIDTLTGDVLWSMYLPKLEFKQLYYMGMNEGENVPIIALLSYEEDVT